MSLINTEPDKLGLRSNLQLAKRRADASSIVCKGVTTLRRENYGAEYSFMA